MCTLTSLHKNGLVVAAVSAVAAPLLAVKSAQAGDVQEAFNQLAGEGAVDALNAMADATLNTVSNVDLMKAANDALIKGMTTEDLPVLTKYAQQLSDLGKGDVASNMEAITGALATGRTTQLKSLGVIIDQDAAYRKYAESIGIVNDAKAGELKTQEEDIKKKIEYFESIGGSNRMLKQLRDELKNNQEEQKKNISSQSDFNSVLDDAQKKAAMHIAIMDGVTEATAKLPEPSKDAADSVAALSAAWQNAQVEIGNAVAPMVDDIATKMMPMFERMYEFFTANILPAFELLFSALSELLGEFGGSNEAMDVFFKAIGFVIQGLVTFLALVIKGLSVFLQFADVIFQWGEVIVSVVKDKVIVSFTLLKNVWTLLKDMFLIGALEIQLVFERMANTIIRSFQRALDFVTDFINGLIDAYNSIASQLGFKTKSHIQEINLSGALFNTGSLESKISALKGEAAKSAQAITINIQQLSGVNPDDMAKALRTKLNDLVST